jgi:hypothetical protein
LKKFTKIRAGDTIELEEVIEGRYTTRILNMKVLLTSIMDEAGGGVKLGLQLQKMWDLELPNYEAEEMKNIVVLRPDFVALMYGKNRYIERPMEDDFYIGEIVLIGLSGSYDAFRAQVTRVESVGTSGASWKKGNHKRIYINPVKNESIEGEAELAAKEAQAKRDAIARTYRDYKTENGI